MNQATPRKGFDGKEGTLKWPPLCNFCGEEIKLHVFSDAYEVRGGGHKSVWMHKTEPATAQCAPSLADELLP
jgi:hypothetical protein